MTDQHPITPPPELVQQWHNEAMKGFRRNGIYQQDIATLAARWGADQELEACCNHIRDYQWGFVDRPNGTQVHRAVDLELARRPKPPSLKQEALLAVDTAVADGRLSPHVSNLVRRALETLDEMSDCMRAGFIPKRSDLDTIRRALEQPAAAPVPVSERLPGPSDCAPWPKDSDASAWCWLGREVDGGWGWEQRSAGYLVAFPGDFTHWLPAHALPVPTVEEVM